VSAPRADEAEMTRLIGLVARLPEGDRLRFLKGLPAPVRLAMFEAWHWQAHGGQREPAAAASGLPWRVWLIRAGRGFGKTRAGAEWVWARAREVPGAKIALVGANLDDVRKVMVEGESGLAAAARSGERVRWVASRMRVDFSNGARGFAYSGERPDKLRGPEHHFAWCDELAKWGKAGETWDNLQMTMRLGERPRLVVTTTPKAIAVLKAIAADPATAVTAGRTGQNLHLPAEFQQAMAALYAGTRLGRQELDGELVEDVEGSLWPRDLIERCRTDRVPEMRRVVIGVDPPAGTGGDSCGIVVCAKGEDGIGYVLEDCSVSGARPEGWARSVAAAARRWGADRVVAESNQGGLMVESVLKAADSGLPVRLASARRGKGARAEPVAFLFEGGKARLAGRFPGLEDEIAGLTIAGGYEGPGRSPDRADAMVWAMTALMLEPEREPRVRML
jgi:phage terminase large subunit-like protein